jgi:hypothetical protein
MVVAIDADSGDVERRLRQLREAMIAAELSLRGDSEAIVHLIPKRTIETWVLCLCGTNVDEDTDYRGEPGIDQQIVTAAGEFYQWSRPNAELPSRCVPSLSSAIPEIRRLEGRP